MLAEQRLLTLRFKTDDGNTQIYEVRQFKSAAGKLNQVDAFGFCLAFPE